MNGPSDVQENEWLSDQVARYRKLHPRYKRFAETLNKILKAEAGRLAPLAIVQARAKSIASFAEKALRKREEHDDPVRQFTDLCGARIICRTPGEVKALSRFIEERFIIDWDNSVDASKRLRPTEFGYRSIHYIVSFKRRTRYDARVTVPATLFGLKAEVQVRTTAEHAWADFGYDLSYKAEFELPEEPKRELHVIAAELEDVDRAFARFEEGLQMYGSRYGSYLREERIPDEMKRLEMVHESDKGDSQVAWRIAKLAILLEDWEKAVSVLSEYVRSDELGPTHQPILRDLGVALCKLQRHDPFGRSYRRGQGYLLRAIAISDGDVDALASYAGTWRGIDESAAREFYQRAFEIDPTDYYPLGNFLEYEIRRAGSTSILAPLRPSMEAAIERCRAQAAVGMNLPWAYFGIGKLSLLLGRPYEGLGAYARAVEGSSAEFMLKGSLKGLEALSPVGAEVEGYEWARRLVLLGLARKFPTRESKARLRKLASHGQARIRAPVILVVGEASSRVERQMRTYRTLMLEAFRDFQGTIISGGTEQGVSGLVGRVRERYGDRVRTIGYLPDRLPPTATVDRWYDEARRTNGEDFSPLEPLQSWIDLLASGVRPESVKVVGIDGGEIAAIEYRIALALGATVAVISDSGRAVADLLADVWWASSKRLLPIPRDAQTLRAFLMPNATELSPTSGIRSPRRSTCDTEPKWRRG